MSTIAEAGSRNIAISEAQLRESLSFITNVGLKDKKVLADLSRVNEQDMFAALTHGQLKNIKLSGEFEQKFTDQYDDLIKNKSENPVFEATRRVIRGMRRAGQITKEMVRSIRQDALGRSQLDSKRDELSTKNVTGKKGDSALRALKTAVAKFSVSVEASAEELAAFKAINGARRAEARAKKILDAQAAIK